MITLEDVRLTLDSGAGAVNILRGVNLEVAPGQAVGLVGPSGSGKSTLLSVIAGLEAPTSGGVTVAGVDLVGKDEDELALFRRGNVGIVFQSFHLIGTMTALENVAVPLEFAGGDGASDGQPFDLARAGLEAVGLADRVEHYPGQLSGGEQQRVALARAVATRPKLLLADEPTGNLDGETGAAIIDLIMSLHDRLGITLLLITHDEGLAGRCDRVVQMADGLIAGEAVGASPSRSAASQA